MPHAKRLRSPAPRRVARTRYLPGQKMRCYAAGIPVRGGQYQEIPVETALEMIRFRFAEWVSDYTAIRRIGGMKELRLLQSFVLSRAFLNGVIDGDPYCLHLWEMWKEAEELHRHAPRLSQLPNAYVRPDCSDNELLMPVDVYMKMRERRERAA